MDRQRIINVLKRAADTWAMHVEDREAMREAARLLKEETPISQKVSENAEE